MLKLRAGLLGLLAMLLLGAFAAAPAFAEGGPYCHHRAIGNKEEGELIKEGSQETAEGEGGEQKLSGTLLKTPIEITAAATQIKIKFWSNPDQCQLKIDIIYHTPRLIKPAASGCEVKIGENNLVQLYGHQVWTWNGEKKQLEEKPQANQHRDWLFSATELQQGATEPPKGSFTTITLSSEKGSTCLLASKSKVEGDVAAEPTPNTLGTFAQTEGTKISGGEALQHFWNGKEYIGFKTGLIFAGEPAKLEGENKATDASQEIGFFEK